MKPAGKNWLFAIVIFGDMIQTFVLELIAVLSPPECVVSPLACAVSPTSANGTCVTGPANGTCIAGATATVFFFCFIGLLAIVPGFVYLYIRYQGQKLCCTHDERNKYDENKYLQCCIDAYAFLGPMLYYYGDNVSKVVDLVGDAFGNCSDDCQRTLRVFGVAALFLFLLLNILIGRISKRKESKINKKWWGPVADMIVELLPIHIIYGAFLSIARSNMIFTSTTFCSVSVVDGVIFAVVGAIIILYTIFSLRHSFKKFDKKENPPEQYKHVVCASGIVVVCGFVVYLLFDNSLPLDFFLCLPDSDMAAVIHYVRVGLSILCAICVIGLWALPELYYRYREEYPVTQAQLEAKLKILLVAQLKDKLKNLSEEQAVTQFLAVAQFAEPNYTAQEVKNLIVDKTKVQLVITFAAESLDSQLDSQLEATLVEKLEEMDFVFYNDGVRINVDLKFVAKCVVQFVAQLTVVAQSVASKCKLHLKVLTMEELNKAVNELRLQSEAQSVAVQLLADLIIAPVSDETNESDVVFQSANYLSNELKVKWCC